MDTHTYIRSYTQYNMYWIQVCIGYVVSPSNNGCVDCQSFGRAYIYTYVESTLQIQLAFIIVALNFALQQEVNEHLCNLCTDPYIQTQIHAYIWTHMNADTYCSTTMRIHKLKQTYLKIWKLVFIFRTTCILTCMYACILSNVWRFTILFLSLFSI